ncbi:M57 family metalloprotease [Sediminibacterium sp.]|jgi:Dual-action HEIGH metallo-peptidase|uniref:M57 family metalloprotease n=1 Tax=Sediminibacterium sp. TaxID=1917865 RepID=UPI0027303929|nr:M57 family metalloprotease [Sediminibacterium sp.]MDP1971745.1 M57 family metalloprotease [Sediminibacterium sp.]MDP2420608.1 M57 family metalloprotease [Sediminibacterium sp.]
MKKNLKNLIACFCIAVTTFSCTKATEELTSNEITPDVIASIKSMGFSTSGITAEDGGYIVEGDIFIPAAELKRNLGGQLLRVGNTEQYRTTNLVTGLPRVITVALTSKIKASVYGPVLDEVVRRYNAQGLQITLQRVTSGANITFDNASGSYLASAGFPTASGNPHNLVKVNTRAIGSGTSAAFINYAATIFAHELGHCIGFRHTDYMDRSYSCGGAVSNEGASTVGAILIPGTPAAADPNSFMLACIGSGVNRPFNANDVTALNYLY